MPERKFSKNYDFKLVEEFYSKLPNINYLEEAKTSIKKKSILLPPPNITGNLHLGHALNSVLQDFIVKYSFLFQEEPFEWIGGIDHAGISTQSKLEKIDSLQKLNEQEKINYALNIWYPKSREIFYQQWKSLSLSLEYNKARFTLQDEVKEGVREAFIKLYNDGLILRKEKIVNWDCSIKTVISDAEVVKKEVKSKLYYIKYFISGSDDYLLVATSRPETIFGDVALFFHPNDSRYQKYSGLFFENPLTKELIPFLEEEKADPLFGTGVFKCSPGHDFEDFELAKKHSLSIFSCCDEKAVLNKRAGQWEGKKINEIRSSLVDYLKINGLCEKVEDYETQLFFSEKSDALLEPILTKQWFLDLALMVKKIESEKKNFLLETKVIPEFFSNVLERWKDKSRDWCISRQLWWGHPIPAWHNKISEEVYVGFNPPIPQENWKRDTDVLDTWFSSALWPIFASHENSLSLQKNFYPIDVLITAYDIIFFWVFRMIVLSFYFGKKAPFKTLLIHGLIRDKKGRKMSKSLGNGVLPEEVIAKFGCDSLRFFLLSNNIWGSDLVYDESKLVGAWRFCQKLWSISNLIEEKKFPKKKIKYDEIELLDLWIIEKLNLLKKDYFSFIDQSYHINKALEKIEKFIKRQFSSEYLELRKMIGWNEANSAVAKSVFKEILLMLYPAIPQITNFILEHLYNFKTSKKEKEISHSWEKSDHLWEIDLLLLVKEKLSFISRNSEDNEISLFFDLKEIWQDSLDKKSYFFQNLEKISKKKILILSSKNNGNFVYLDLGLFGSFWYKEDINVWKKRKKLEVKKEFYEQEIARCKRLLSNQNFLLKAPSYLVESEKKKELDFSTIIEEINKELEKL